MANVHFLIGLVIVFMTWGQITSAITMSQMNSHHQGDQQTTTTQGDGGERCGKQLYKCGQFAYCMNNETCVCPPNMHGNPHLICIDDNYFFSDIVGDPKASAFDGGRVHVDFPCRLKLAHIQSPFEGGICEVQIFVINHFFQNEYYVMGHDLRGTLIWDSVGHEPSHFHVRIIGVSGDNNTFVFEQKGGPTAVQHPPGTSIDNVMNIKYCPNYNIAEVKVDLCGMAAYFRPKVRHTHQRSGYLLSVIKDPNVQFFADGYPLASTPYNDEQPMIKAVRKALGLQKKEAALYLVLSQQANQDIGDTSYACFLASKEFNLMCTTTQQKVFALRKCAFIYIDRRMSECLSSDSFGVSTNAIFTMCIQSVCLGHRALCRVVKSQLRHYHCPPGSLQRLSCNEIRNTMERETPNENVPDISPNTVSAHYGFRPNVQRASVMGRGHNPRFQLGP